MNNTMEEQENDKVLFGDGSAPPKLGIIYALLGDVRRVSKRLTILAALDGSKARKTRMYWRRYDRRKQ